MLPNLPIIRPGDDVIDAAVLATSYTTTYFHYGSLIFLSAFCAFTLWMGLTGDSPLRWSWISAGVGAGLSAFGIYRGLFFIEILGIAVVAAAVMRVMRYEDHGQS